MATNCHTCYSVVINLVCDFNILSYIIFQFCAIFINFVPFFNFVPKSIKTYTQHQLEMHHDIEDEFHFVLKCKTFQGFRNDLIKPYYWKKSSMYKFIQLLSSNNIRELCNLGKFLFRSFKLKDDLIVSA
jgi:hypothetical protein